MRFGWCCTHRERPYGLTFLSPAPAYTVTLIQRGEEEDPESLYAFYKMARGPLWVVSIFLYLCVFRFAPKYYSVCSGILYVPKSYWIFFFVLGMNTSGPLVYTQIVISCFMLVIDVFFLLTCLSTPYVYHIIKKRSMKKVGTPDPCFHPFIFGKWEHIMLSRGICQL